MRQDDSVAATVTAVLGPTNTGKTHYAVERLLAHSSGMIGLPLRLLAKEVYDKIAALKGRDFVALITGEEKILPPKACYLVCTVEAMPLQRKVACLVVDEIQLCGDRERGHIFTHRLLHARGQYETLFLGAMTMAPLIRHLLPGAKMIFRERFSELSYRGAQKLTRLPRRSAIVAFSTEGVYEIAELVRHQKGGAAVVTGSLSPRTRNAQVALYQSGEVDFLVATDAIGMGLNMDVDHVAFAGLSKFDGRRTRPLTPQEIGQVAGRAGRYRKDGSFGVTAELIEMAQDWVGAVESHNYQALNKAQWRSAELDFSSLTNLIGSLGHLPQKTGLILTEENIDEASLKALARDDVIRDCARNRKALTTLWEVCQMPDFRKTTVEEHVRLLRGLFGYLISSSGYIPNDWIARQFKHLDRQDGEISQISQRLSGVRTLAYIAHRGLWLQNAAHWQEACHRLEDQLSDSLHEKLMQRFVDRRTSALVQGLAEEGDILAGVSHDGKVTVEGYVIGKLSGLVFEKDKTDHILDDKILSQAAERALRPEISRRLQRLIHSEDQDFQFTQDGYILWQGGRAGKLNGGQIFQPETKILTDWGSLELRLLARARLESFLRREAERHLVCLDRLKLAVKTKAISGLARGVAFELIESGGILPRSLIAKNLAGLSREDRRNLSTYGIRFGRCCLYLPELLSEPALMFMAPFGFLEADLVGFREIDPERARLQPLFRKITDADAWSNSALAALGLCRFGGMIIGVERLEAFARRLPQLWVRKKDLRLDPKLADKMRWSQKTLHRVLTHLGYHQHKIAKASERQEEIWRWQPPVKQASHSRKIGESPFDPLITLRPKLLARSGSDPASKIRSKTVNLL